ncbi:MAG: oligosaccharide flippase family protein, partial [Anaerolineales bacterium]|nr:oligosaccharide flippase family protein [Anaerolineales bacterium]
MVIGKKISLIWNRRGGIFKTILAASSAAFFIQGVGLGLRYLSQILLARWLGANEYGTYSYLFSWVQVLSLLSGLGFTISLLRFVPEYITGKKWGLLKGIVRRSRQMTLFIGLVVAAVGYLLLSILGVFKVQPMLAIVGMGIVPLYGLLQVQVEVIRSLRHIVFAYFVPMILQPLIHLSLLFILGYLLVTFSAFTALLSLVIGLVPLVLLQSWFINRFVPQITGSVVTDYQMDDWLRISLPLLYIAIVVLIQEQSGVLVVGSFLSAGEAGIYMAAMKTAVLGSFVLIAVNTIVAPMIGAAFARQDKAELQQIVRLANGLTFGASILVGFGLILTGKWILGIFGHDFQTGYHLLITLALGQIVNASAGPVGYLIILTGHQRDAIKVYSSALLISMALML